MNEIIEIFSPALLVWQLLMILVIVLPIVALIDILRNDFKGNNKVIWVLMVLLANLVGVLLYVKYGTKQKIRLKP